MADTARNSQSGLSSDLPYNTDSQLPERKHAHHGGTERRREDLSQSHTFEFKQPTRSKSPPTISAEHQYQPKSLTDNASKSDQTSSLEANHTNSSCSSISTTIRDLMSDVRLSPTAIYDDIFSISAWTYVFDDSHRQYMQKPSQTTVHSACLNHTPTGSGKHMAYQMNDSTPIDRWINEAPGEGYEVAVQLRHQVVLDCSCIAIQDIIDEDIDGMPHQDMWNV